jgi:hypothetical protein
MFQREIYWKDSDEISYACYDTGGVHSALVRVNEELLERKVAAPV